MKLLLLLFAVITISLAQTPCSGLKAEQCVANKECGFCAVTNGGTSAESFCTTCDGSAQCSNGEWVAACECHQSMEVCERNGVPGSISGGVATTQCKWCNDKCHNPLDTDECCAKSNVACKAATDSCFFCESKDTCIIKSHQANECPDVANPCDTVCLAVHNPVCGSDGITYSNPCELEKKIECHDIKDLKKLYDGPCCDNLPEGDCKEAEKCAYCNDKCMLTNGGTCPRFDCFLKYDEDDCVKRAADGCLWCDVGSYCYNTEGDNSVCEDNVSCEQASDQEECRRNGCSWCNAKDKCQPVNVQEDVSCRCSMLKEAGCKESKSCDWCKAEEACLAHEEFERQLSVCRADDTIDKCTDFDTTGLSTADQVAAACDFAVSNTQGECKYCSREKICLRSDLPENERPSHCDCKLDTEAECKDKSGCTWCKDTCILASAFTPDRCTDKPCVGRERADCSGDCEWCSAQKTCYSENAKPNYCYCSSIIIAQRCEEHDCLWCADDSGNGKCTEGTTCESGTKPVCSRNMDKEQCDTCRDANNQNRIHCGDVIGCIPGDTCEKPTTDECDRRTPTPILECIRKRDDGYVACLTAQNSDTQVVEFAHTSDRNVITGVAFSAKDIVARFAVGRQSAYPSCLMRVPFKAGETGKWCICDECIEFDENSPKCERPTWKIVIQFSADEAALLRKIKEWITFSFSNLAKRLADIKITIAAKTKRQGTAFEAQIELPEDTNDADIAAVDDSINDKDSLGASLGGSVSSIQNSGSTVAQNGQAPASQSSATTMVFGFVMAVLLALLLV